MVTDKELLDLYLKHGRRTDAVSSALQENGVEISGRSIRDRLSKSYPGYSLKGFNATKLIVDDIEESKPIAAGMLDAPDKNRMRLNGKRFVFTSAQNNTFIHEGFYKALMNFTKHNNAQLIVSRFTYNKSGFQNGTKDNEVLWYAPELALNFIDESAQVADGLVWCGELDVIPTATNPLTGFENYTHGSSAIIPHAKVNMNSLPRMKGDEPRFLYSTGAVTLRNYIQRKAGQKAEFHHVFGALYVEVDDAGRWFARQLIADNNGDFYDLTTKYTADGVLTGQQVEAINYGDIHVEKANMDVSMATYGDNPDSMLEVLNPTYQFIHDLSDFSARNHHNLKDPFFLAEQHFAGTENVEAGLAKAYDLLRYLGRKSRMVVVVESNHDLAYQRWLKEADIRFDPENAEFFHLSNARQFQSIRETDKNFSIFEWAMHRKGQLDNTLFLREDDSFVICHDVKEEEETGRVLGGIECGMHGHRGPNGSRGNPRMLKAVGRKCNLGHSHSAGIIDGCYIAGVTADLDLGYNKGPSSWSHSHIVTYPNGKRTIVTVKDGKWRA